MSNLDGARARSAALRLCGDQILTATRMTLEQIHDASLERLPELRASLERDVRAAVDAAFAETQDLEGARKAGDAVALRFLKDRYERRQAELH